MKSLLTACLWACCACSLFAQTNPELVSVYFEHDRSELTPEARQTLDAFAARLLAAADCSVEINAYTDDRGTAQYNERLALDRAAVVQNYLVEKGVPRGKSGANSWGERKQKYDNNADETRRLNRRVDVSAAVWSFQNVGALMERLAGPTQQTRSIDPTIEQTVVMPRGLTLIVPPNSFVLEDGSAPAGPVELLVTEALQPSDWIMNGLTTMSDGKILQSGGMARIEARSNGRTLQLADEAYITVAAPAAKFDPEMSLFYGASQASDAHAAADSGAVNWVNTKQKFRQKMRKIKIRLDIDPAVPVFLAGIKPPLKDKPKEPEFDALPPEPKMPVQPVAPRKPAVPTFDQARRNADMSGGSAAKRRKKAEAYYAQLLAVYRKDSVQYEASYERFQRKKADFQEGKEQFERAQMLRQQEIRRRVDAIKAYERACYIYEYAQRLPRVLKNVSSNLQKYGRDLDYYVDRMTQQMTERDLQRAHEFKAKYMPAAIAGMDIAKAPDVPLQRLQYERAFGDQFLPIYQQQRRRYETAADMDTTGLVLQKMLKDVGISFIADTLTEQANVKMMLMRAQNGEYGAAFNGYVADIAQLGWVNVDKFMKMEGERTDLIVSESEDAAIYAVSKETNSILRLIRHADGRYIMENMPKNMKLHLVAIKINEGKPRLAILETTVARAPALNLEYQSVTISEMRQALGRLNG